MRELIAFASLALAAAGCDNTTSMMTAADMATGIGDIARNVDLAEPDIAPLPKPTTAVITTAEFGKSGHLVTVGLADKKVTHSAGYNRRGSKDSQLR